MAFQASQARNIEVDDTRLAELAAGLFDEDPMIRAELLQAFKTPHMPLSKETLEAFETVGLKVPGELIQRRILERLMVQARDALR